MTDTVLEADSVTVDRGGETILSNISFTVPAEAQLLIQGPSGAGKTTLFNILGLLDTPSSGTVSVRGTNAGSLPERKRARIRRDTIGFIFQDFQLIDDLTARENAGLPQEHTGSRDEEWLDTLFEKLNIRDLEMQYPATLSGGEKQRVAIARALANRPAVVLADEPTGQLDPDTTEQVIDLLLGLQATTETALVTISHDTQLESLFQSIARLEDGELTLQQSRSAIV